MKTPTPPLPGENTDPLSVLKETVLRVLDLPDILAVLNDLRRTLGTNTAYRNLAEGRTWIASDDLSFTESVRLYPTEELKRLYPVFPVRERASVLGFLILEQSVFPPETGDVTREALLVDVALRAIRLLLRSPGEHPRQEEEWHETLWNRLMEDPVEDGCAVREELRTLGFPTDWKALALAFSLWNVEERRSPADLEPWIHRSFTLRMKAFFRSLLFSRRDGCLACALAAPPGQEFSTIWRNIGYAFDAARKELPQDTRAYLGVGAVRPSVLDIAKSYEEARMALAYAQGDNGTIAIWECLGDYRILGNIASGEQSVLFRNEWLGKILEFDRTNQTHYLETLAALERHNWNLAKTAEAVSYHVNSIKYRHRKIEEILELDTENPDVRFNLALALRLMRYAAFREGPKERRSNSPTP